MYIIMLRTVILYFLVVLTMRVMGKRQIGQLQPFELVITIMISELASLPMQDTRIPLIYGIIPIVTLLFLEIVLSVLQLKSEKARIILSGEPTLLINKGKIDISALKSQRLNINDLMEELRLKNYFNVEDIEYAILETSGQISLIPKTHLTNATKEDLNLKVKQENVPITIILDGKVNTDNIKYLNKDAEWLMKELKKNKIDSPNDVFLALIDSKGKFYYQKYNN
ncbi:membrane protein [Clostridium acetobutylicum]|nr:membrane protein [Clostridium acetobutylicum]